MVSNGTMKHHTCCFDLNYNNTDAARLGLLHYSLDAMRPTWSDLLLDFLVLWIDKENLEPNRRGMKEKEES